MKSILTLDEDKIADINRCAKKLEYLSSQEIYVMLCKFSNGSNIHTVNKAKFYLDEFEINNKSRFMYGEKYDRLRQLKLTILLAITWNDIDYLSDWIKTWW